MTLGLLKACSKGLVLKVMFIQFSAGERYTKTKQEMERGRDEEGGASSSAGHMQTALTGPKVPHVSWRPEPLQTALEAVSTTLLLRAVKCKGCRTQRWFRRTGRVLHSSALTTCAQTHTHSSVATVMSGRYSTRGTATAQRCPR